MKNCRALSAAVVVVIIAVLLPQIPSATAVDEVNVVSYGARPNDEIEDTSAIQRAIDAVASGGGGRVRFPRGTFDGAGIIQKSNVELYSSDGAILRRIRSSDRSLVEGELRHPWSSISKGSDRLRVSSAAGIVPGTRVAVRGARGGSTTQATTLALPVPFRVYPSAGVFLFVLDDMRGFSERRGGYLVVDDEIISYESISPSGVLFGVRRGRFGTSVRRHAGGAKIAPMATLYATVMSVDGSTVVLDRRATIGIPKGQTSFGATRMVVRGLIFDGNRPPGASDANPHALRYEIASRVRVTGCTIKNGEHGGISLEKGTANSLIEGNTLSDNGDPENRLGSSIWLFGGVEGNTVRGNVIHDKSSRGSTYGILIDDRSDNGSEWDGTPRDNVIERNSVTIDRYRPSGELLLNSAILVEGGQNNVIRKNKTRYAHQGITIVTADQGVKPIVAKGNAIVDNDFADHYAGIWTNGQHNAFDSNAILRTSRPCVDYGSANSFTANTSEGSALVCERD